MLEERLKEQAYADEDEEQRLWSQWTKQKTAELRTQLFFFYSGWLRMLAGYFFKRYPHPLAEWGDYLNLCSLGLLQAIERFDLTRGVRFKTYAEHFIKGAVLKGLASYIKDQRAISKERVESIGGVNRFDTKDSDLELVVNAAVGLAFGYFLELGIVEEQPADNDPLAQYVNHDISNELAHLVESLPERERQVIVGHYFQQMSFTSLSELLGVSRSRVSQLHGAALERIRFLYEGRGP
tara:strand:- start:1406 stop:2119 length:714 start_codon:yes stop_codon:yes gene_type:complete